jgi:hypothetical protein
VNPTAIAVAVDDVALRVLVDKGFSDAQPIRRGLLPIGRSKNASEAQAK